MKILSILTPKRPLSPSDVEKLSLPEEQKVWLMYTQERVREFYFQPDPMKVLLVWEGENQDTVHELIKAFPMVREDLFFIELIHLGPWLPFQVLFRPEALQASLPA